MPSGSLPSTARTRLSRTCATCFDLGDSPGHLTCLSPPAPHQHQPADAEQGKGGRLGYGRTVDANLLDAGDIDVAGERNRLDQISPVGGEAKEVLTCLIQLDTVEGDVGPDEPVH